MGKRASLKTQKLSLSKLEHTFYVSSCLLDAHTAKWYGCSGVWTLKQLVDICIAFPEFIDYVEDEARAVTAGLQVWSQYKNTRFPAVLWSPFTRQLLDYNQYARFSGGDLEACVLDAATFWDKRAEPGQEHCGIRRLRIDGQRIHAWTFAKFIRPGWWIGVNVMGQPGCSGLCAERCARGFGTLGLCSLKCR